MSGTFPTSPLPAQLTLKSVQPTLVSVTHSLRRQVRSRGGQRFGLVLDYPHKTRAEMAPLMAFALSQRGQFGTFTLIPAILGRPQGSALGVPVVNGAHSAGSRSISVRGGSYGATLKAGDLLKFAGHSKVYMLVIDATANASGEMALTIEPGLFSAVADAELLVATDVPMTCALANDAQEWSVTPGVFMDWRIEVVEAL